MKCYHAAVRTAWNISEIHGVSQALIEHLSHAAKRHDAWYLKRLPEAKRYAMVSCFLVETWKTILDHLIEMNDQHLTKQIGECRKAADERQREYWKLTRAGQDLLIGSWNGCSRKNSREEGLGGAARPRAAALQSACVHYRESRRRNRPECRWLRERLQWQVRPYLRSPPTAVCC